MNDDLVSIIIPCFNRQSYLLTTLNSCLAQSYQNIEIIIVDDGSTDETFEIAQSFAREFDSTTVLRTENRGQCSARNIGLQVAKGKYVKFLDSDDLLLPNTIEDQIRDLHTFHADLSVSATRGFWDNEMDAIREQIQTELTLDKGSKILHQSVTELHENCAFTFNEVLISREIVVSVDGFASSLRAAEETNLILKISIKYPYLKTIFDSRPLLMKRLSHNSLAVDVRRRRQNPYPLMSLEDAALYYFSNSSNNIKLKEYIFDRLYIAIIYAYRNAQQGSAAKALTTWENANLEIPKIEPWYHYFLHRFLGFTIAERTLDELRNIRNTFKF